MKSTRPTPEVTVFISTKNRPALIRRAIDSILSQSFSDFELIVLDVSDNEQTFQIMEKYNEERIVYKRIINEESPAKTVNKAIFEANGEFIALCDDDDEWSSPEKLSKQMALIKSLGKEYGFVSCGCELWNDSRNAHIGFLYPQARGMIFPEMLKKNVASGTPTQLIRKSAFIAVGGYDEECRYSADYLLYTKLSRLFLFDYVSEVLVLGHLYHDYGSQQNLIKSKYTYLDKIEYFERFLQLFKEDYELYPESKREMLETIITLAAKSGEAKVFNRLASAYYNENSGVMFIMKRYCLLLRSKIGNKLSEVLVSIKKSLALRFVIVDK